MIIAIDPGKKGAFAVHKWGLSGEGITIESINMPKTEGDVKALFDEFREHKEKKKLVVMERVGGYVGGNPHPSSAMFNFGDGYGFLKACAMCNGFKLELVTPQNWQRILQLGTRGKMSKTQWKNKLKGVAQRLYPDMKVTNQNADALLILEYAVKTKGPLWY